MSVAQVRNVASPGAVTDVFGTPSGAALRVTKQPEHLQGVLDGQVYTGANPLGTPVTTQAGLSATTPALTLHNPAGSGVNLVLIDAEVAFAAAPAALCNVCLAYDPSVPTALTPANVLNNSIGNANAPLGKCSRIATLGAAPVAFELLGTVLAAAAVGQVPPLKLESNGKHVIQPGQNISVQTSSAASVLAKFTWKEVPIGQQ